MALTRRLQVLLDEERFERLERQARDSGASIGLLVRRAIDEAYPPPSSDRRRAAEEFLASEPMPVEDWDVMKRQILDEVYGGKDLD